MPDDLEVKLPLRYLMPELVRQHGTEKILRYLVEIYDEESNIPVWHAGDWTRTVGKRYAACMKGLLKDLQEAVHKLDLDRLRDLEDGPAASRKRWDQQAKGELKKYGG